VIIRGPPQSLLVERSFPSSGVSERGVWLRCCGPLSAATFGGLDSHSVSITLRFRQASAMFLDPKGVYGADHAVRGVAEALAGALWGRCQVDHAEHARVAGGLVVHWRLGYARMQSSRCRAPPELATAILGASSAEQRPSLGQGGSRVLIRAAVAALTSAALARLPRGVAAVSRSCACIGSPCLRNCVHGASIGGGGGGGGWGIGRLWHGRERRRRRRHHGGTADSAGSHGHCLCARRPSRAHHRCVFRPAPARRVRRLVGGVPWW
jgi:hypothetical protein